MIKSDELGNYEALQRELQDIPEGDHSELIELWNETCQRKLDLDKSSENTKKIILDLQRANENYALTMDQFNNEHESVMVLPQSTNLLAANEQYTINYHNRKKDPFFKNKVDILKSFL